MFKANVFFPIGDNFNLLITGRTVFCPGTRGFRCDICYTAKPMQRKSPTKTTHAPETRYVA